MYDKAFNLLLAVIKFDCNVFAPWISHNLRALSRVHRHFLLTILHANGLDLTFELRITVIIDCYFLGDLSCVFS